MSGLGLRSTHCVKMHNYAIYALTYCTLLRIIGLGWRLNASESASSLKLRPTVWPRGPDSSRRTFAWCGLKSGTIPASCGRGGQPPNRIKPSQGRSRSVRVSQGQSRSVKVKGLNKLGPAALHPRPQTQDPRPQTPDPRPKTPDPRPKTQDPTTPRLNFE